MPFDFSEIGTPAVPGIGIGAVDETRPSDNESAMVYPEILRETRALLNALIGGAFSFTDNTTGKRTYLYAVYEGLDDNNEEMWSLRFSSTPPET